jgi:hypothetical protein
MTEKLLDVAQRSTSNFKHVQASNIWAFVHGKGELNYEEHHHLKRCTHCEAIFKYFVIYGKRAEVETPVEDWAQAA